MSAIPPTIVLIATQGESTSIIYNALKREHLTPTHVLIEDHASRYGLIRRRVRRLGAPKVCGQLLFQLFIHPLLRKVAQRRIAEIIAENGMDRGDIDIDPIYISSINDDEARTVLKQLDPTVVIISGTRIVCKETLECIRAPFINMHAGITPTYRGVHGGYWALVEGMPERVGTTIHLVDSGIDTGAVIAQRVFSVTQEDCFASYPYLHLAAGLPVLIKSVNDVIAGRPLPNVSVGGESHLRYHPTALSYLRNRFGGHHVR
jgi:folate-dependent phosphoribosylglycinamide formyltransferase PurN